MSATSSSQSHPESVPAHNPVQVVINEITLANFEEDKLRNLLLERINPDSGILNKLLASKALTRDECHDVRNQTTPSKRNLRLIELVTGKQKLVEFFHALKDTHQEHLVNYINANGEYKEAFHGVWPLKEREVDILDSNQASLVEIINVAGNELVNLLYQYGVLNKLQWESICRKATDCDKNEAILDILFRSSLDDYHKMICCLQDIKQFEIATLLQKGGVILSGRFTLNGEPETVSAIEDEMSTRYARDLAGMSIEEIQRTLELTHLKVIGLKRGKSIHLYIYCETLKELISAYELVDSGLIKTVAEDLFNRLISHRDRVIVSSYHFPPEEYAKLKSFLEAKELKESAQKFEPMEVEQHKQADTGEEEIEEKDEAQLKREAAEQAHAEEIETDQRKLGPDPFVTMTETEKMAAKLRNNFDYLMEFIDPKGLVDKLHAMKWISDDETRYIKTLSRDEDKNNEVLKIIRGHGLEAYNDLLTTLREKGQDQAADVAEKGGVVARATIIFEMEGGVEEMCQKLVEGFNHLLKRTGPVNEKVVLINSLLAKSQIEIIEVKYYKDFMMWFWCRSPKALETLDEDLNESKEDLLNKILARVFELMSDNKSVSVKSIILEHHFDDDLRELEKSVVCKSSELDFSTSLPTEGHCVLATTGRESDIYILCQNPSMILVFSAEDLTLTNKIPVHDIRDAADMVASGGCLYILDIHSSSILRLQLADNKISPWMQPVGSPYILSVSRQGYIMKIAFGSQFCLEFYDESATKIHSIPLPTSMDSFCHAIELPSETYVFSFRNQNGDFGGVCEITGKGEVLHVFNSSLQRSSEILGIDPKLRDLLPSGILEKCPYYLTVAEHCQVIFATDESKDEIMVFDRRLMLEDTIKRNWNTPLKQLHYIKSKNQLLVVCGFEKTEVRILQLKEVD